MAPLPTLPLAGVPNAGHTHTKQISNQCPLPVVLPTDGAIPAKLSINKWQCNAFRPPSRTPLPGALWGGGGQGPAYVVTPPWPMYWSRELGEPFVTPPHRS